jgi:hypothetical protein
MPYSKPIVVTRIFLEILLLLQSDLCDFLNISTENTKYIINKYCMSSFLQDIDKITLLSSNVSMSHKKMSSLKNYIFAD